MFALVFAVLAAVQPRPLPLIGFSGLGHACPTETAIYTAHHVLDSKERHMNFATPYGIARPAWTDTARDLATISIDARVPRYQVAGMPPEPKEKVHWYEFNLNSKKDYFKQERRDAKILRTISGHIVFDKSPVGGASGSCLLNEREEVVGIVIWSLRRGVGVAVSIVDKWQPKVKE